MDASNSMSGRIEGKEGIATPRPGQLTFCHLTMPCSHTRVHSQAFLTAVMQTYAREHRLPLDVMMFMTEVTNKTPEQITEAAPVGSYIHGLYLEGARCGVSRGGGGALRARGDCVGCIGRCSD